jgi:serine/threonine-protein kinase
LTEKRKQQKKPRLLRAGELATTENRVQSMAENSNDKKATPTLQTGETLGKYEVCEILGMGGQSVVYKGYDPLLDRHVAIKQLAPHLAQDETYLNRMRENVRAIAKLGSRNEAIINILDVIEEPRGMFYVMEFVEGHTLQAVLQQGGSATEPRAVLLILFRLAGGLHDIHAAGIVHRDLKPSNIIITEGLHPKIIDFEVAALHGGDISMPLATTKYLAPEVYTADSVDGRADIYSLGFIAYELLLGEEKFNEVFEDVVRDPHSAALRWMKWHGNDSVEAPPLHEVDPSIPLNLSHLVAKMIEKDPENRFQDTEELGRAMKKGFSAKPGKAAAAQQAVRGEGRKAQAPRAEAASQGMPDALQDRGGSDGPPPLSPNHFAQEGPATAPLPTGGEGPPTAPLPKGPMTRRTKIRLAIAGGVVLLALIATGVGLLVMRSQQAAARRQQADAMYSQGVASYQDNQYDEAARTFQGVMERFPGSSYARRAEVVHAMARTWQAIRSEAWDDAQQWERQASEALDRLHKQAQSETLVAWTREREDELEGLRESRLSAHNFSMALNRAEMAIESAVSPADYTDALRVLRSDLDNPSIATTIEQDAQASALMDRIRRERLEADFGRLLKEADQQAQLGNFQQAEQIYNQAMALLQGEDEDAKLVPAQRREDMQQQARQKLAELTRRRQLQAGLDALAAAEQQDNEAAVRQALEDLLRQDLSEENRQRFQDRLTQLKVEQQLELARAAQEQNDLPAARMALQKAQELDPENAQVVSMMGRIDTVAEKQQLINQGDVLQAERKYAEALKKYSQAAGLGGADESLQKKINECNYNLMLAKAQQARQAGQYTQAERAYEEAKTIKPEAKLVVDAQIADMRVDQTFDAAKAQADALIAEEKWDEAVAILKEAQESLTAGKVKRKETAQKAISFALYRKYLQLGNQAVTDGDPATARWYYRLAKRQIDTPEIQRKLQAVGGGQGG